jgi:hypothetical protein
MIVATVLLALVSLLMLICVLHDFIAWAMKPLCVFLMIAVLSGWTGIPIAKFYDGAAR